MRTEEFFDAAVFMGGESCESGIIGGDLFDDGFFVGDRIGNVVEAAVQLVKHGGLIGYGGRSRMWTLRRWLDAVDGCSGVCSTYEVALCVGGVLLAFNSELGHAEG